MKGEKIMCMFGCIYFDDGSKPIYKDGYVDDVYSRHWENDCKGNPDAGK